MILESNDESIQSLIDMAFDALKVNVEDGFFDVSYVEDSVYVTEEIKVVDVQKVTGKNYLTGEERSHLFVTIDVYIDGKLVRTGILPGTAKINPNANIFLTPNGGFNGWTSKLQYWNNSSNPQMAWDTYMAGYGAGLFSNLFGKYKVKVALLTDNQEKAQFTL